MPRQQGKGVPSAPSSLPSPSASQPPPIIVLPTEDSPSNKVVSIAPAYEHENTMASQEFSTQGVKTVNVTWHINIHSYNKL